MEPYPDPSYHDRSSSQQPAYLNHPDSFSTPVEMHDTPIPRLDTMDTMPQSTTHRSPEANLSKRIDQMHHGTSHFGRANNLAVVKETGSRHREPVLEDHASRPEARSTGLGRTQEFEGQFSHPRHEPNTQVHPSFAMTQREETRGRPVEERLLQPLISRARARTSSDAERLPRFSGAERQRHSARSRGPTPDGSPQRFLGSGRAVHGLSPSPNRRLSTRALSSLPRIPIRGIHKA